MPLPIAVAVLLAQQQPSRPPCEGPATPSELLWTVLGPSSGYDGRDRPNMALVRSGLMPAPPSGLPHNAPPEQVEVSLQLYAIPQIDQQTQTVLLDVFFRTWWVDPRLAFNDTSRGGCFDNCGEACEIGYAGRPGDPMPWPNADDLPGIWTPYLWEPTAASDELTFSESWWIRHDGRVWWTRKSKVSISCLMNFQRVPYDTQTCRFKLASFRDSDREVQLVFFGGTAELTASVNPALAIDPEWELSSFTSDVPPSSTYGSSNHTVWFTRSAIDMTLVIERKPSYYEIYVVTPCIFFAAITYASFFVSRGNGIVDRLAMVIINLLVIETLVGFALATLPKLAGQVWLLGLLGLTRKFILYSIFEYVVCDFLCRVELRVAHAKSEALAKGATPSTLLEAMSEESGRVGRRLIDERGELRIKDQHFDLFSRFVFPVAYGATLGLHYARLDMTKETYEDAKVAAIVIVVVYSLFVTGCVVHLLGHGTSSSMGRAQAVAARYFTTIGMVANMSSELRQLEGPSGDRLPHLHLPEVHMPRPPSMPTMRWRSGGKKSRTKESGEQGRAAEGNVNSTTAAVDPPSVSGPV